MLMVLIAGSSFFIHDLRAVGPFSPIHLLSIFTLIMFPLAVMHARRHCVKAHRRAMIAIFFGALVIAGLFTVMPGRIMHAVLFSPLSLRAPIKRGNAGSVLEHHGGAEQVE